METMGGIPSMGETGAPRSSSAMQNFDGSTFARENIHWGVLRAQGEW